jgi:transcriptional regulator with XRE-family HTH domain
MEIPSYMEGIMSTKTSTKNNNDILAISVAGKGTLPVEREPVDALVGVKIREIRTRRGWTLKSLAEHSKLNINTLSMIEKGKTSPSIGTLQRLARALEVPIITFFESDVISKPIIFTAHDHRPEATCCHALIQNLGKDLKNGAIEPFIITMPKYAGSGGRMIVHTGLEFAYCLSGKIQYIINEIEYPMTAGDSIVFEAHIPHRWENIHDGESQIILVLSPADQHDEPGKRHFTVEEGAENENSNNHR